MFQLWGQSGRVSIVKSSQVGPVVSSKWSEVLCERWNYCHRLVMHAITRIVVSTERET